MTGDKSFISWGYSQIKSNTLRNLTIYSIQSFLKLIYVKDLSTFYLWRLDDFGRSPLAFLKMKKKILRNFSHTELSMECVQLRRRWSWWRPTGTERFRSPGKPIGRCQFRQPNSKAISVRRLQLHQVWHSTRIFINSSWIMADVELCSFRTSSNQNIGKTKLLIFPASAEMK